MKYTVKKGDSLSKIAVAHGLGKNGYKQIAAMNPQIKNINKIFPGQVIEIPETAAAVQKVINNRTEQSRSKTSSDTPGTSPITAAMPSPTPWLSWLIVGGVGFFILKKARKAA